MTTNREQPRVSSPEEIRKKSKKEEIVAFPSGFKAKLRQADLAFLIQKEMISAEFINKFIERSASSQKEVRPTNAKEYKMFFENLDAIVKHAFIEPEIVDENPEGNQITLEDLSDQDKTHAYNYALSGFSEEGERKQKKSS